MCFYFGSVLIWLNNVRRATLNIKTSTKPILGNFSFLFTTSILIDCLVTNIHSIQTHYNDTINSKTIIWDWCCEWKSTTTKHKTHRSKSLCAIFSPFSFIRFECCFFYQVARIRITSSSMSILFQTTIELDLVRQTNMYRVYAKRVIRIHSIYFVICDQLSWQSPLFLVFQQPKPLEKKTVYRNKWQVTMCVEKYRKKRE